MDFDYVTLKKQDDRNIYNNIILLIDLPLFQ